MEFVQTSLQVVSVGTDVNDDITLTRYVTKMCLTHVAFVPESTDDNFNAGHITRTMIQKAHSHNSLAPRFAYVVWFNVVRIHVSRGKLGLHDLPVRNPLTWLQKS